MKKSTPFFMVTLALCLSLTAAPLFAHTHKGKHHLQGTEHPAFAKCPSNLSGPFNPDFNNWTHPQQSSEELMEEHHQMPCQQQEHHQMACQRPCQRKGSDSCITQNFCFRPTILRQRCRQNPCCACMFAGSAYGPRTVEEAVTLQAQPSSGTVTPYLAPLRHGTPLDDVQDVPFNFHVYQLSDPEHPETATGAYYEIKAEGRYLLQYGLSAQVNCNFQTALLGTNGAVVIQIRINDQNGNPTRIGAIPLALTHTSPSSSAPTECVSRGSNDMVCGFGQISLNLSAGDQVALEIVVETNTGDGSKKLVISPDNITDPITNGPGASNIDRGPTLSITRLGDVQRDTPE